MARLDDISFLNQFLSEGGSEMGFLDELEKTVSDLHNTYCYARRLEGSKNKNLVIT